MTDVGLVLKKLTRVELCLADLATVDLAQVRTDRREQRFAEHTLQIAIQAILDVAAHIVSTERLGDPTSNHALFDLLAQAGWIDAENVGSLRRMAGLRNILVHEYEAVDLGVLVDVVQHRTGDLRAFVDQVRARLGEDHRL